MKTKSYYFGVSAAQGAHAGHFLWGPGWRPEDHSVLSMPRGIGDIDGKFMSDGSRIGEVVCVRTGDWTALSWWDTSGDPRQGSHSTFLFDASMNYAGAMSLAKDQFPEVFERITFDLRPYETQGGTNVPIDRPDGLTAGEGRVMGALAEAANGYQALDSQHPSEKADFVRAIHTCQDLLAVRIARRHYPEGCPNKSD